MYRVLLVQVHEHININVVVESQIEVQLVDKQ